MLSWLGRRLRAARGGAAAIASSTLHLVIDAPLEGDEVGQPFLVRGWAADLASTDEVGVDMVAVYANAGSPEERPLGLVRCDFDRPDVAEHYGRVGYRSSGFALVVSGLAPGDHMLYVAPHGTVTGQWGQGVARRVRVTTETLAARPSERPRDYRTCWDLISEDAATAFQMMDRSTTEEELQRSGMDTAERLRQGLAIRRSDMVLEIGCGVARIGRELALHCSEWHGVDVSRNMIRIAEERTSHLPNTKLQLIDSGDLSSYPDDFFDKVYSTLTLFHLDKEDMFAYIQEIRRVLKVGGIAYYDTWNLLSEPGWERWEVERQLYRQKSERPPHRNQWATPEEMRCYTERAGLTLLTCWDQTFFVQILATKVPSAAVTSAALVRNLKRRVQRRRDILVPRGQLGSPTGARASIYPRSRL